MGAAERPPSRQEVEAVGDYLDSRCSDFSDEGEDALCAYQGSSSAQGAYQGEHNAEAETEAADLAWRHPNPNPNPTPTPSPSSNPKPSPSIEPKPEPEPKL